MDNMKLIGYADFDNLLVYRKEKYYIAIKINSYVIPSYDFDDTTINDMLDHYYGDTTHHFDTISELFQEKRKVYGNPDLAKEYFKDDGNIEFMIFPNQEFFYVITNDKFSEKQNVLFDLGLDFYD